MNTDSFTHKIHSQLLMPVNSVKIIIQGKTKNDVELSKQINSIEIKIIQHFYKHFIWFILSCGS